jgi:hypothetical protein
MLVSSRIGIGLQQVRVMRGAAKMGCKWRSLGNAGADGRPWGVLRMKNRFAMARSGEIGVQLGRFWRSQRKSQFTQTKAAYDHATLAPKFWKEVIHELFRLW